ncbi:MAG: hypothetical protein ABIB79_02940 [archaeon]
MRELTLYEYMSKQGGSKFSFGYLQGLEKTVSQNPTLTCLGFTERNPEYWRQLALITLGSNESISLGDKCFLNKSLRNLERLYNLGLKNLQNKNPYKIRKRLAFGVSSVCPILSPNKEGLLRGGVIYGLWLSASKISSLIQKVDDRISLSASVERIRNARRKYENLRLNIENSQVRPFYPIDASEIVEASNHLELTSEQVNESLSRIYGAFNPSQQPPKPA